MRFDFSLYTLISIYLSVCIHIYVGERLWLHLMYIYSRQRGFSLSTFSLYSIVGEWKTIKLRHYLQKISDFYRKGRPREGEKQTHLSDHAHSLSERVNNLSYVQSTWGQEAGYVLSGTIGSESSADSWSSAWFNWGDDVIRVCQEGSHKDNS